MKTFVCFLDEKLEEVIAMFLMILMAVLMCLQVVARYVFNNSLSWPEEICVYMLIWMGMISLSYCIRKNSSIKVEMIINILPVKIQNVFHILEHVIGIVFYGFMFGPAWSYLHNVIVSGQVSPALHLPLYFIQVSPLVAFSLAIIRSVEGIVVICKHFDQPHHADC